MYLYINTASADSIFLALIDSQGQILIKKTVPAKYMQSEKLLLNIQKLVNKKLGKLKGIIVIEGPGSFTALRIGVTTANTMAWALQIPIIGISLDNKTDEGLIKEGYNKLKKIKKFKAVMPKYGRQPNITIKIKK